VTRCLRYDKGGLSLLWRTGRDSLPRLHGRTKFTWNGEWQVWGSHRFSVLANGVYGEHDGGLHPVSIANNGNMIQGEVE